MSPRYTVPRFATANGPEYYSRNSFYSFNTQIICDSEYKFRWKACTSPDATHDSTAFTATSLGRNLMDREGVLTRCMTRDDHYISADEAYAASEVLAVQWPGGG